MTISVGTPTASNSTSITIPSTTAGATLVVCVMSGNGSATPSVSGITIGGSASNFAQLKSAVEDFIGGYWGAIVWACPNCPGGQTAIVISGSNLELSSGDGGVVVYEAAGLASSSLLDKSNDDTGSSGSPTSGASGTTTQAAELVIGCAVSDGSITGPSGGGWTNEQPAGNVSVAGYQIASSTGSFTYTTTGGSGPWAAAVVTLFGAVAVPVSSSDTGSGAESSTIAATLSSSDTGSGADVATVGTAGTETGSGADTASPPPATLTGAEAGSGADAAVSVAITSSDTGSGADVGTAVLGASGSDTGSGAESAAITGADVTSGDTGTGAESSAIAATAPTSADTGSGADVAGVAISGSDTGTGTDLGTQAAAPPPRLVLWRAPDRLSKTGGTFG